MRLALLGSLVLGIGCHKEPPFDPALTDDSAPKFVKQVKERLDHNQEIYDAQNKTVRGICKEKPDIQDCKSVIPRLPEPTQLFR